MKFKSSRWLRALAGALVALAGGAAAAEPALLLALPEPGTSVLLASAVGLIVYLAQRRR